MVGAVAAAATGVLTLTACDATTDGNLFGGGSTAAGAINTGRFAHEMQAGIATATSAKMTFSFDADATTIRGSGSETLADGKPTGIDLTETVPGSGEIRVLQVGDLTYVQLPSSMNTSGKPWALVRASSSNPAVQAMASSIDSLSSSSSLDSIQQFVQGADSVVQQGTEDIDGQPATKYRVTIDVAKVSSTNTSVAALKQFGIDTLPLDLYLDSKSRPLKMTMDFGAQGHTAHMEYTVSDYDAPVTIQAPPADQVDTD